ncbi:SHOCT domain-containing protein [Nitrincola schmidtii]|uniref:SHOCT domain-containing protein n=1 Tax=Nitrincola schmidtii TaxID=1730894 RepID=UPI00124D60C0|nr:SHOCT domain-containing protein [Nitrincola schmidtii]
MQNLTQDGQQLVNNLSAKYNLSYDAVMHMLIAVNNGCGTQAQFNCPELGGAGQWMRGGMTMVGDMFNYGLKMTVDNLCSELSNGLANLQVFVKIPQGMPGSSEWWPGNLGNPFSTGAQNNIRYAVFPNRLAVELNGQVTVYDTLDHSIGGVSQQQGGDSSLTFSSQYGTISVNSLPIISGQGTPPAPQQNFAEPIQPQYHQTSPNNPSQAFQNPTPSTSSVDEAIQLIEKLAKLKEIGAISDEEYHAKKTELLNRI